MITDEHDRNASVGLAQRVAEVLIVRTPTGVWETERAVMHGARLSLSSESFARSDSYLGGLAACEVRRSIIIFTAGGAGSGSFLSHEYTSFT